RVDLGFLTEAVGRNLADVDGERLLRDMVAMRSQRLRHGAPRLDPQRDPVRDVEPGRLPRVLHHADQVASNALAAEFRREREFERDGDPGIARYAPSLDQLLGE